MTTDPFSTSITPLAAGRDLFDGSWGLGISRIAFKLVPGLGHDLLILENVFEAKGGPPRHLHYAQDEWFYALEGEFLVEVGQERVRLTAGASLLAPRGIPHVWAHVGPAVGRMLIVFTPAGQMEAFFRAVTPANAMPSLDPQLWQAHGMELVGPPLPVA